jgi:tetratricopeptide repeat protein 30
LLKDSSPEDAYKKFDDLGNEHIEQLRKITKQVQEARQEQDGEALKTLITQYDECIEG